MYSLIPQKIPIPDTVSYPYYLLWSMLLSSISSLCVVVFFFFPFIPSINYFGCGYVEDLL